MTRIDRDHFLSAHSELMSRLIGLTKTNYNDGVKRHLQRGLNTRLAMIEISIIELDEAIRDRNTVLDVYKAESLCLHLNSYYINIVGGLDNLAWALLYRLMPAEINENKTKYRKLAVLSNPDLHATLINNHLSELAASLVGITGWLTDLKKFRDPSAHRIPLLVPPSILSKSDVDTYHRLDQEAAVLIQAGDHAAGMVKLHEAYSLGSYHPVFICENSSIEPYHLTAQLNQDHQYWLTTVNAVLKHAFPPA